MKNLFYYLLVRKKNSEFSAPDALPLLYELLKLSGRTEAKYDATRALGKNSSLKQHHVCKSRREMHYKYG